MTADWGAGRTKFRGCNTVHDDCDFSFRPIFTFNNNVWLTALSDHPQISPPWWWDNHKMRARKNIADNRLKMFATGGRSCAKTNVNSVCGSHWSRSNRTNQRPGRITTVPNHGSAEPRQLIWVLRWCYISLLEIGSNLRSTLNLVQLIRRLIDVGETCS